MNQLRPFDKHDWIANAGATVGSNGEQPKIFSCDDFEIIVDCHGIEIRLGDEKGGKVYGSPRFEREDYAFYEAAASGIIANHFSGVASVTEDYVVGKLKFDLLCEY